MALALPTPRQLHLDGPLNARDLGGLPLLGGGATRFGVAVRSDAPVMLSERDSLLLTSIGVSTIIDLRTDAERLRFGVADLGDARVDVRAMPLFDDDPAQAGWPTEGDLLELNRRLLQDAGPRVVAVLGVLARASGTTLVHCTAGKDRTGLVAALALLLVGVRRHAVVADYAASEVALPAMAARFAGWPDAHAVSPALFRAPPEVMDGTIEHLGARFGGAAAWARSMGWTDEDQEHLVARLVDRTGVPLPDAA